jgi:hypothetical protein
MLFEYEMSGHIAKHEFMSNYLVWHQHGEVQAPAPTESNESDDKDRMDDMIVDIDMKYDLRSRDQYSPSEMQNFYRLLATSDEKVHDSTLFDRTADYDVSYGDEIKVQLLKSVLQRYHEFDY